MAKAKDTLLSFEVMAGHRSIQLWQWVSYLGNNCPKKNPTLAYMQDERSTRPREQNTSVARIRTHK
ncbi:hypothetical protein FRX31_021717 [Thalictrum thalictroides]|uniref:Uncharacterized protein n=1 Tax=Thalictrum thalictroides TaxID=46969 RepID=A0A7J6VVG4_THATH|nr:hypothetical protein FRX31_021717 [Thalictrum thalictroides]